jgi:hypothetical protein
MGEFYYSSNGPAQAGVLLLLLSGRIEDLFYRYNYDELLPCLALHFFLPLARGGTKPFPGPATLLAALRLATRRSRFSMGVNQISPSRQPKRTGCLVRMHTGLVCEL